MLKNPKRAVGFCTEAACADYSKGVFLLNHGKTFHCARCTNDGIIVAEQGFSSKRAGKPFREVRVEFNYDSVARKYRETAIVSDEAMPVNGNWYTLFSPIVKTEKRALKIAESVLANLQRSPDAFDHDMPQTSEVVLSFDEDIDVFIEKLETLAVELKNSNLVQRS